MVDYDDKKKTQIPKRYLIILATWWKQKQSNYHIIFWVVMLYVNNDSLADKRV